MNESLFSAVNRRRMRLNLALGQIWTRFNESSSDALEEGGDSGQDGIILAIFRYREEANRLWDEFRDGIADDFSS